MLTARGSEMEREFAYGVMRQLFEAPLTDAVPERQKLLLGGAAAPAAVAIEAGNEGAAIDAHSALEMLHAFAALVANLAAEQPLMLAVDDLHWADISSVRALG